MEAVPANTTRADLLTLASRMHEGWGDALCLDFANTLEPRGGPPPFPLPPGFRVRDELASYGHLVAWSLHHETLDESMGLALLRRAAEREDASARILARAQTLRDGIYRVFWSIARGSQPAPDDLATLQREYVDAAAHAALVAAETVRWDWPDDDVDLARPLWPVAWSAVELLTAGEAGRIKACPGGAETAVPCAWLFYDATKNRSRRWCSMADCGGATKARRQTDRRRAARARNVGPNRG